MKMPGSVAPHIRRMDIQQGVGVFLLWPRSFTLLPFPRKELFLHCSRQMKILAQVDIGALMALCIL